MLRKGQRVVRVINVMGSKSASLARIKKVADGAAKCFGDDHLQYDAKTGREISPAIPGCWSELIPFDGADAKADGFLAASEALKE